MKWQDQVGPVRTDQIGRPDELCRFERSSRRRARYPAAPWQASWPRRHRCQRCGADPTQAAFGIRFGRIDDDCKSCVNWSREYAEVVAASRPPQWTVRLVVRSALDPAVVAADEPIETWQDVALAELRRLHDDPEAWLAVALERGATVASAEAADHDEIRALADLRCTPAPEVPERRRVLDTLVDLIEGTEDCDTSRLLTRVALYMARGEIPAALERLTGR